jgi:hypothetical protein
LVAFIFRCLIGKKLVGSDKSLESDSEIEPNVRAIMIVKKFKKISYIIFLLTAKISILRYFV